VGLAANQVGLNKRIILITLNVGTKKEYEILEMINPEIVELSSNKVKMEEGCLSLPNVFEKVLRPNKVKVKWQNMKGDWRERNFENWDARIFLHEYDHLDGVLFTDYLK
jgi:peptide deformylase